MERLAAPKSFLDSSIVRPCLLAARVYRDFLASQIPGPRRYVSNFVLMEVRRGLICPLIDFYFVIDLPTIHTLGDALTFWSEQFAIREMKTVLQFAGQLFTDGGLDTAAPKDKRKGMGRLASLVERLDCRLVDEFTNTGVDSARCARAAVEFDWEAADHPAVLRRFRERFGDEEGCRARCRIDHFLFKRYRREVVKLSDHAASVNPNRDSAGFRSIDEELNRIQAGGPAACSCKRCERIGDAVIALDAPRYMQLEHTDHSFDYLCPPIGQPHRKHPSQSAVVTGKAAPAA